MTDQPGLDCIPRHRLHFDIYDEAGFCVGSWCAWCGTASFDGDRIGEDNQPIGFAPVVVAREPGERPTARRPARRGTPLD